MSLVGRITLFLLLNKEGNSPLFSKTFKTITAGKVVEINGLETHSQFVISKDEEPLRISVDNKDLGNVSQFQYLGSLGSRDSRCIKKIMVSIAVVKDTLNNKRILPTGKLSLQRSKNLLK